MNFVWRQRDTNFAKQNFVFARIIWDEFQVTNISYFITTFVVTATYNNYTFLNHSMELIACFPK